jgi:hypothetical protein
VYAHVTPLSAALIGALHTTALDPESGTPIPFNPRRDLHDSASRVEEAP